MPIMKGNSCTDYIGFKNRYGDLSEYILHFAGINSDFRKEDRLGYRTKKGVAETTPF
jgi:hypothetical protein